MSLTLSTLLALLAEKELEQEGKKNSIIQVGKISVQKIDEESSFYIHDDSEHASYRVAHELLTPTALVVNSCKMSPRNIMFVKDGKLYLGGFHVNGNEYQEQNCDPNISESK